MSLPHTPVSHTDTYCVLGEPTLLNRLSTPERPAGEISSLFWFVGGELLLYG